MNILAIPETIGGMPFWTFLTIVIVSGLIFIMTVLYVVLWGMARRYRTKNNLHGDIKDYANVVKEEGDKDGKA